MKPRRVKVRKTWDRNPVQRPHSTRKGKRGYDRKETRRIEREAR